MDAIPNIIRDGENGLLVEVDDDTGASNAVLRIYQEDGLKSITEIIITAACCKDMHSIVRLKVWDIM